jgi:methoxymalonate biosynthesis acyl carrier protein
VASSPTTERVQRLFVETLNTQAPAADTDLIEGGLLDSLALVELLLALEREFGVTIALEELEIDTFRSVASIVDFIAGAQAVSG